MYKLTFFVPLKDKEKVKEAVFEAGAGQEGLYRRCSFEVVGLGQFHPLEGARPAIGQVGAVQRVEEARVEVSVPSRAVLHQVAQALKEAHPYEVPVFDVVELTKI